MLEDIKKERVKIYEIDDKKYTVISKCVDNTKSIDNLYSVLCRFAMSKLDANV